MLVFINIIRDYMQFRDLQAQYEYLKLKIDTVITDVVSNCEFINGKQVSELELELAQYVGTKHCITCGNGTDALTMMMMAWGITEGDAVFVPDFTFFATGEIVSFVGATPIFYDVYENTYNASAESLEMAIQEVIIEGKLTPKVVIAVDLFGQPADYQKLEAIAKKYGLLLLEDGAQGFGGMIGHKMACSFGDAATTSFFPAKPLGCYGDGGAIFINDDKTAEYLKSIRVHGKGIHKYDNIRIGCNSRLDTIQAAILKVKFDEFRLMELEKINDIAKKYSEMLQGVVIIPCVKEGGYSSWAQYTIQLESKNARDAMQKELKEQDIPTMIYYPKPLHQQVAFKNCKKYVECPVTERLCDTVLSLPIHPYLKISDVEFVCTKIKRIISQAR